MTFVNKVWDGTRFVNTDSDTLDSKHLSEVYEKARTLADNTSTDVDTIRNEEFCRSVTGTNIGNGQISRDGFYLWVQNYGERSNQVAFTPTSIKYRTKNPSHVWTSWKELSTVGHTHTVSNLTDHDTLVKIAGSNMTGALKVGTLSGSTFTAKASIEPSGQITTQSKLVVTGGIEMSNTLKHGSNIIISADGKVHSAVYNDLAEYFLRKDQDEYLEPGDILVYDNGGVTKSTRREDKAVVGVYSDTFGISLGGDEGKTEQENLRRYVPVGLAGRVHVKVVGEVSVGDLITSSEIPGVGRAAIGPKTGSIVGKALETHTGDGIDRICLLVLNQ